MLIKILLGVILVVWGLFGIIKKRMLAPWALTGNRYMHDASANRSQLEPFQPKNYIIYGWWAILEGSFLLLAGALIIAFTYLQ